MLQRRTGIPITLGVLYMVVAQRLGLSLHGLNLPGHFMVGNNLEGVTNLLVDPFDGNAYSVCVYSTYVAHIPRHDLQACVLKRTWRIATRQRGRDLSCHSNRWRLWAVLCTVQI